jgi:hypothetical protein
MTPCNVPTLYSSVLKTEVVYYSKRFVECTKVHGVTSRKPVFFIVTSVWTSSVTYGIRNKIHYPSSHEWPCTERTNDFIPADKYVRVLQETMQHNMSLCWPYGGVLVVLCNSAVWQWMSSYKITVKEIKYCMKTDLFETTKNTENHTTVNMLNYVWKLDNES